MNLLSASAVELPLRLSLAQTAYICVAIHILMYALRARARRNCLKNVPGPAPHTFLLGNFGQLFDRQGWNFHRHITQDFGGVVKLHGIFSKPLLYVYDPEALQSVMSKDQNSYDQAEETMALFGLIFGPGMPAVKADVHRKQRRIINPAFSITNIRSMLPRFYEIGYMLRERIALSLEEGPTEVDMLELLGRTALEIIGQCGLGYSFKSLSQDGHDEYAESLQEIPILFHEMPWIRELVTYLERLGPGWLPRLMIEHIPHRRIYQTKREAFDREYAGIHSPAIEVEDMIDVFMRANVAASESERLSEGEIVAQMSTMIIAGADSTAATAGRILHRLAENTAIQHSVREEILEAQRDRPMSFDEIIQLPILNAVCRETLRVDPPVHISIRTCIKDTFMSLSKPILGNNGTLIDKLFVPQGTDILLGVLGSNTNKELWGDDALQWKPERWLSSLPEALEAIPGVYANLMSFTGGQRSCIGFKFAELEIKLTLSILISEFVFELPEEPITWNMAQVCYPTVGKAHLDAKLPLRVSSVSKKN